MRIHTCGDERAPVVIMLPGSFCNADTMTNIVAELEAAFRILAVDYNGQYRNKGLQMFFGTFKEIQVIVVVLIALSAQISTTATLEVHPGDIVLGDCDGVVVVPKADEDAVFEKAIAKFEKEQHIVDQLLAGKTTLEVYGFDRLIERKQAQ